MLFRSTVAAATGAALFSLAAASEPVCKVIVSVGYGEPTWVPNKPAPTPTGGNGWQNWSTWVEPIHSTTSLSTLNPVKPTGWATWQSQPAKPTTTKAPEHSKPSSSNWKPWTQWTTMTTVTGNSTGSAIPTSTTTSSVTGSFTGSFTSSSTSTITSMTTATTTTSDSTTTTTTTTPTTTANCPAPTVTFVLRALNTDNNAVFANYAELVTVTNQGNIRALSFTQGDNTLAQGFTFNSDCQITFGPSIAGIIDVPSTVTNYHNVYLANPAELTPDQTFTPASCIVDETDLLTCSAAGETIFQFNYDAATNEDGTLLQISDEVVGRTADIFIERTTF